MRDEVEINFHFNHKLNQVDYNQNEYLKVEFTILKENLNYTKLFTQQGEVLNLKITFNNSFLEDFVTISVPQKTQLMGECASEF